MLSDTFLGFEIAHLLFIETYFIVSQDKLRKTPTHLVRVQQLVSKAVRRGTSQAARHERSFERSDSNSPCDAQQVLVALCFQLIPKLIGPQNKRNIGRV